MFFGRFVLVMDTSVGFFGKKTKRLLFLMFGDGAGGYRMLHESERFCKIDKWQWRIQEILGCAIHCWSPLQPNNGSCDANPIGWEIYLDTCIRRH